MAQKYPPSAGKCERCGYFKTWSSKIMNPKTGKMMPAHIASSNGEEAPLLGNGDCPSYHKKDPAREFFNAGNDPQGTAPNTGKTDLEESLDVIIALLEQIVALLDKGGK